MSNDKVISMEDFRRTERKLKGEKDVADDIKTNLKQIDGWTKVVLIGRGQELLTIVEQGYDEDGVEHPISGIALDRGELEDVMEQLQQCLDKMDEYEISPRGE